MFSQTLFIVLLVFASAQSLSNKLALIVINGLTNDYLKDETIKIPNLKKLTVDGVLVENITPEFPASQLPFITSLVNGRHSLDNRVLGEETYDTEMKKTLVASTKGGSFWDNFKATPTIWDLNQQQGANRGSKIVALPHAEHMISDQSWIGDPMVEHREPETTTSGTTSTLSQEQSKKLKPSMAKVPMVAREINATEMRLHMAICVSKWLMDDNINFVTMYMEEPGRSGEMYGPKSTEAKEALESLDIFIGELLVSVESTKKEVNFVVASTPGFVEVETPTLKSPAINLDAYEKEENYLRVGSTPVLYVAPTTDPISVFLDFKPGVAGKNFEVYSHQNYPEEWHFDDPNKVLPVTLVADEGKVFTDFYNKIKKLSAIRKDNQMIGTYGCNGYDNRLDSMKTILIGKGPDFVNKDQLKTLVEHKKAVVGNATVVDVHALLVYLLGATDVKGHGKLENMYFMLKYRPGNPLDSLKEVYDLATKPKNLPVALGLLIGGSCLICLIIVCLAICCKKMTRRRKDNDASYRYTKVQNRRIEGNTVMYSNEDKQSLLKDPDDKDEADA